MSESKVFEGRTAAMRTSPWLASEDIDGLGDVDVTIEAVYEHKNAVMQDGRKQPRIYTLKFVGKERQMVLNATNRKTLVGHFGTNAKEWAGKAVKLFVQDGVRSPSGGTTKGIRSR